jgi:excinuclease ABC subunit C
VKIPAATSLDPQSPNLDRCLVALPSASGVYLLQVGEKPAHLAWAPNLPRRLTKLLVSSRVGSDTAMGRLRSKLARIECWPTGSRLESSLLMYELARSHFPREYVKRLRLRMPWFLGLASTDPFPRLTLVNRLSRTGGPFFGPFPSRDVAQRYEQEILGLFQLRRCTERLAPHPEHPGCIYGEMNQCLRPCQCAVSTEEYTTEAQRVAEFL